MVGQALSGLYYSDPEVALYAGDALQVAQGLASGLVQTIVTSPPYFGLRDYGEDGQVGAERTVDEYVETLVTLFRELRRVLADDGLVWLNLGDTYNAYNGNRGDGFRAGKNNREALPALPTGYGLSETTLPAKTLIGVPWRVALALQADGWLLRSDIIWHKPNPMPESIRDRPTKAHEYIFMLSKGPKYFYDAEAGAEPALTAGTVVKPYSSGAKRDSKDDRMRTAPKGGMTVKETRNRRDVWTVGTTPFPGAHFATYPPELIRPCVVMSSRVAGKRCDCDEIIRTPTGRGKRAADPTSLIGRAGMARPRRAGEGGRPMTRREQRGYAEQMKESPYRAEMALEAGSAFTHYIRTDKVGARPLPQDLLDTWLGRGWLSLGIEPCEHPVEPSDIVLDPFSGSGTTGMVALEEGRRYIGIELNTEYLDLSLETRFKGRL
jgi:DNA modification methylase